jgi:two-component system C4-dicarboxylate transport response regulator DctD
MPHESGARPLRSILFVDDDPEVRNAFQRLVSAHGMVVDLASNGEEALQATSTKAYAVIVTDHQMPGLSGVELVARLRAVQPQARLVLVTGYCDLAVQSCRVPGVSLVISKPWDPNALLALLGVHQSMAAAC